MIKKIFLITCFLFVFQIGRSETVILSEVKTPGYSFHIDGSEMFLVDGYSILVYNLNPVELKFKLGKKGEGPTDFKYPPLLYVYPDAIVALDYTKSLWFSRKGKLLKVKDYRDFSDFDLNMEMRLLSVGNHYVCFVADHDLCTQYVTLLNHRFEKMATLHEGLFDWWPPVPGNLSKAKNFKMIRHNMDVVCHENTIFISDSNRGFFIKVFDHSGKLLRTIVHNSERCKRVTESYKKRAVEYLAENDPWNFAGRLPKEAMVFYTFFPPVESIRVTKNRLFATTYVENEAGHEIIVMNHDGSIIKRIYPLLPSFKHIKSLLTKDLYAFDGGKLYELVKDVESKCWGLRISSIDY